MQSPVPTSVIKSNMIIITKDNLGKEMTIGPWLKCDTYNENVLRTSFCIEEHCKIGFVILEPVTLNSFLMH